jgi:hypothetical protein
MLLYPHWHSLRLAVVASLLLFSLSIAGCAGESTTHSVPERHNSEATVTADRAAELRGFLRANTFLSVERHTPWELAHAALGLGFDAPVLDERTGSRIPLGEVFRNGPSERSQAIYRVRDGFPVVRSSQGSADAEQHAAQFLAYFALLKVQPETPIRCQDQEFNIDDLVKGAIWNFDARDETSWVLIALSYYRSFNVQCKNKYGDTFDIDRLVRLTLDENSRLPCGGTHRLFSLAYALECAKEQGVKDSRLWDEVSKCLKDATVRAKASQLADGSIPFCHGQPMPRNQIISQAKLLTTGHSLEWICEYIEPSEMESPWFQRALQFLTHEIEQQAVHPPPAAEWFHAIHALSLYCERREKLHYFKGLN